MDLETRRLQILQKNVNFRENRKKMKDKKHYERNKIKYQNYYQNNKESLKEYQRNYYQKIRKPSSINKE